MEALLLLQWSAAMLHRNTLKEIEFLLDRAEGIVWKRAERVMHALYWDVGYCLREYPEEEISALSEELSFLLGVEAALFLTAYAFYKKYPIREKALRGKG